jgi:outer membrane protein TolC
LTRDEAVRLALGQASVFQQAQLSERSAEEDVRQARTAFLPRLTSPSSFIYTSPNRGPGGTLHEPSFISADALTAYEALAGASGELDLAGRLRATLRRNRALLAAAHAGTEVARRALIEATEEAYYGLALATARRRSVELSLTAAEEFERITGLMANAGEVAQVDLIRARLQTTAQRDALEQARASEAAAADGLRVFVGYDFGAPLAAADLATTLPEAGEIERFAADAIAKRPEFTFFDAQRRAAEEEVKAARAERRPQLTYSILGGFDSDSLRKTPLHDHTGVAATVSLTIPIFDWGASKSREQQARLRAQTVESTRTQAQRGFTQQFYTARAQALSAAARIKLAEAGVADAQRNVDLSIARYRVGEAAIIEVTDAQSGLAAQRAALSQAIFDYQVGLTRLRQATGQ